MVLRKRTSVKPKLDTTLAKKALPQTTTETTVSSTNTTTTTTTTTSTPITSTTTTATTTTSTTSTTTASSNNLTASDNTATTSTQNPSQSTTVSVISPVPDTTGRLITNAPPKNDEAVQEAIQFLTSQKLEPIKTLNLQNKNVKMRELLFVNPPMTKEQKRHKKLSKPKQASNNNSSSNSTSNGQDQQSALIQSPSKESTTSDIECLNTNTNDSNTGIRNDDSSLPDEPSLVPQVKVGPDGKLILDEKSTIITRKNLIQEQEAIVEDEDDLVSKTDYNSYRPRNKTNKWTTDDTKRFYHGMTIFGTDFSMMESLLFNGKRSRAELHKKFKREERLNKIKVEIALNNRISVNSEELNNLLEIL